jgi:hypothetical protein
MNALTLYLKNVYKVHDFVLIKNGNVINIHFGAQRFQCPYHGVIHEHENMFATCADNKEQQGLNLKCYREGQGEVPHTKRVFIDV